MKTLKTTLILSFILITQLSLIQAQQNVKNKALLVAAQANDIKQVKKFVEKGANINATDKIAVRILMFIAFKAYSKRYNNLFIVHIQNQYTINNYFLNE